MSEPLLEVEDLTVRYSTDSGPVTAVSNASFTIREGEYYGLVGESGCGKSTLAKSIFDALDDNGQITGGSIRYRGQELGEMSKQEFNDEVRWTDIAFIPQASMDSLDPLQRLSDQAAEIAERHTDLSREEAIDKFLDTFEIVGLKEDRVDDYPHEFSGGMQQRAIIALALFLEPSLLIADEPTTALDVILQDQIFKHLVEIKEEMGSSMLLITHDISLVFESCDRLTVMHGGQVAESGSADKVYSEPLHPYSVLLQGAFPDIRYPDRELSVIEGTPPETVGDVDYCTFVDRCPWATADCKGHEPPLEGAAESGDDHEVACFNTDAVRDHYSKEVR